MLESMQPNVLLVAKEDERKLQFQRSEHKTTAPTHYDENQHDQSPYRYYMHKPANMNTRGTPHDGHNSTIESSNHKQPHSVGPKDKYSMMESYNEMDPNAMTPGRNYRFSNAVQSKFMSIRGNRSKAVGHSLDRVLGTIQQQANV